MPPKCQRLLRNFSNKCRNFYFKKYNKIIKTNINNIYVKNLIRKGLETRSDCNQSFMKESKVKLNPKLNYSTSAFIKGDMMLIFMLQLSTCFL